MSHCLIEKIKTKQHMGKLDGKIALITGGSDGIGLATAQRFIAEGAEHVFITGRRQNALDEAVKKINSEHVTAVQGDVSNMADLDRLVQKALPIFTDGGSIILNASVGSIKAYPNESVYSASKAAVRSFARCWTVDLKERRIRVNALSPGAIDTPILRNTANTEEEQNAYINQCAAATPMNRIGTPDEVAKAVVFLASNDSSYITGIELFVDGGMGQIRNIIKRKMNFIYFQKK
jgi:NAD(P)-dependent dehydrogenase (short-subunit alcohol dehydrogenase family)